MSNRRPRIAGERRRSTEQTSTPLEATESTETSTDSAESSAAAPGVRPPRPSRPPLSRRAKVVLAGLGVLAVVAVAFAVVATLAVRQTESAADERVETADRATAAATPALETVLSYRHASVADDLEAATDLMTDEFAEEYEQLAPQVASAAKQRKIDVAASVRAIAPLECGQECSDTSVRLLAFVDQHRTVAGKPGSPAALSVVVRMEKIDGDWLVAELTTT
ncbi:hypothetical protein [Mumia sp. Pv 4-285]|uniref:hypothetical protein n=1 Tax=Mumia qirimensis TaxID=3234852 RepID=UPI00351D6BFF